MLFRSSRPRQLWRNGAKKKTASEIAGVLPTVLFCPEDLMILKTGGAQRRRFADNALCQLRPNYEAALTEYNRILEQKGRILKDRFENPPVLEILPEYNARLCQVGALLISYRARFFQALAAAAAEYHSSFTGGKEEFRLDYKTVSSVSDMVLFICFSMVLNGYVSGTDFTGHGFCQFIRVLPCNPCLKV